MKQIWQIAYYRCRLLWQQRLEVLFLSVAFPLILVGIAYFLQANDEGAGIPIALVDLDQSEYSQTVAERILKHPLVEVVYTDAEEARRLVLTGRIEAAYIINAGFMEQIQQGQGNKLIQVWQGPAALAAGLISERLASETMRLLSNAQAANYVQAAYMQKGLLTPSEQAEQWQEIWQQAESYWEPQPLMSITYREWTQVSEDRQLPTEQEGIQEENRDQSLERQQLLLLLGWLSALLMLLVIYWQQWLVTEKLQGIQARLQLTGFGAGTHLLGNSLPFFLLALLVALFSLGLVSLLYSYQFSFSPALLSLLVSYVIFCLGLGLALATWSRSMAQFQGSAFFLVLCTSLFGGSFFPVEEWSSQFSQLSYVTPQGWLLWGIRESLLQGSQWFTYWPALLFCGGLGLCFYFLGWWRWSKG